MGDSLTLTQQRGLSGTVIREPFKYYLADFSVKGAGGVGYPPIGLRFVLAV